MATTRMSDADVLKALNHPVRRQVMAALDDGVHSPKELAAQFGLSIPNVSYHVGILRDLGLIKVVRETPRRGAVERHYKATARAVGARQVVDWVLSADQAKPRGWDARALELDKAGLAAVRTAAERFWKDVEKAERAAAKRGRTSRVAVGTFATPA